MMTGYTMAEPAPGFITTAILLLLGIPSRGGGV